jgi:hypothetical protein
MRADLGGRGAPPVERWMLLAVLGAVAVGVLGAAWLFGLLSGPVAPPGASPLPSPTPAAATPFPTPGGDACPTALLTGTLVHSELSGVAVETDASVVRVLWPAGYGVRQEGPEWVLLDERARPLARTGDRVEVGGGFVGSGDDVWLGCGGVTVVEPG